MLWLRVNLCYLADIDSHCLFQDVQFYYMLCEDEVLNFESVLNSGIFMKSSREEFLFSFELFFMYVISTVYSYCTCSLLCCP